MSHVFLRYIFGILPVFLALVPDDSSASINKIRAGYTNVLFPNIQKLETMIGQCAEFTQCNTSVCSSTKRRTIHKMACYLRKMTQECNLTDDLKKNMDAVSGLTLNLLEVCNNPTRPKQQKEDSCQDIKGVRNFCHACFRSWCHTCCRKKVVSQFMSCWFKVMLDSG
ncbi:interleukin-7-like isoform X2 [Rhineura floridana]|uniref:interleukin-7-like isoform X2 n=1 Tax=Rhineura floridana TaxID=261503 RepID=UPI002AC88B2D|nr:interleukin-7-like isoform X2 [Rhineura floridana]